MSEWDIYAVGDVNFLYQTIAATAEIFGKDGFENLIAIGFGFGIIWLFLNAIMEGGTQIKFGNFFVAALLYMVLFGTTAKVYIYDGRSLSMPAPPALDVEDVPLGLAATGSLLSQFGNVMSDWYTEQYTDPAQGGAAGTFALQALFEMRGMGSGDGSLNWDRHGHTSKSLQNYVRDCVVPATTIKDASGDHPIDAAEIAEAEDLWTQLEFNSSVYRTEYFGVPTGPSTVGADWTIPEGQNKTCGDAWELIGNEHLSNTNLDRWKEELVRKSCQSSNENCNSYLVENGGNFDLLNSAVVNLDTGIDAIIGADVELDTLLINRAITGAIDRAGSTSAVGKGDLMISTVMSKASAAMTTGQALEKGMFERTMRPLMTFFEAMMFIAAPFAAFAVTLGGAGLGILSKYLLFALWIQLWNPVLAATNMYIHMAASGSMRAMQQIRDDTPTESINLASLQMQPQLFDEVSHWIGTGSMLSAATPALTLMLMYGSAITASSLASRIDAPKGSEVGMDSLKGESKIGEKIAGIDQHGNISEGVNQYSDKPGHGSFQLEGSLSSYQQRASRVAQQASTQATDAQKAGVQNLVQGVRTAGELNTSAIGAEHGEGWADKVMDQTTERLAESGAISDSERDSFRTHLGGSGSLGLDVGEVGKALSKLIPGGDKAIGKLMSQGAGAMGVFLKAFDAKVGADVGVNDAFEQALTETKEARAIAEDVWNTTAENGLTWGEMVREQNQTSVQDTNGFTKALGNADEYTEQSSRANSADEAAEKASKLQASGMFSNIVESPGMVSKLRDPATMAGFEQHVRQQQMNPEAPAYYQSLNPDDLDSTDFMNTLRASGLSGNLSDTANLLGALGGYDQVVDNINQLQGLLPDRVGATDETSAPEMPGQAAIDDKDASGTAVDNAARNLFGNIPDVMQPIDTTMLTEQPPQKRVEDTAESHGVGNFGAIPEVGGPLFGPEGPRGFGGTGDGTFHGLDIPGNGESRGRAEDVQEAVGGPDATGGAHLDIVVDTLNAGNREMTGAAERSTGSGEDGGAQDSPEESDKSAENASSPKQNEEEKDPYCSYDEYGNSVCIDPYSFEPDSSGKQ